MIQVLPPATQPASKDADSAALAALKKKLPQAEFSGILAEEVISYLRDLTGSNIVVNWSDLVAVGIEKRTPVNLKLKDAALQTVLEKALEDLGGVNPLGFEVKDGVINISTKDSLSQHTVTRLYEVRDLVSSEPFSSQAERDDFELTGKVIELIARTVDRSSWIINSGASGDICAYQGTLLVTQNEANHQEITALLDRLRQGRYPQWERELRQRLGQTRVRVDFQSVKFDEALEALRSVCGLNIVLDPPVGIKTSPPITLRAGDLSVQQVLNLIARMEGLTWTLADGVIYISRTQGDLPVQPLPVRAQQAPAQPSTRPALADPVLQANADQLKNTIVAAQLGVEMPKNRNVLWCATFQLAWNELMDYAGGPVEMENAPAMVGALNQRGCDKGDIDDASVVALAGQIKEGVLAKARDELRSKFPDFKPRLLPAENTWPPEYVVMYACLLKQMPFECTFARGDLAFGRGPGDAQEHKVASFGLHDFSNKKAQDKVLAAQVKILWHRFVADSDGGERFVVELLTKAKDDRLILALLPPKPTLAETVADVMTLVAKPNTKMLKANASDEELESIEPEALSRYACLAPGESLNVPVLDFEILRDYNELCGKKVKAKNPKLIDMPVVLARQTIRFRLNESGAKLESETVGLFGGGRRTRDFTFNRPFLVMLMRKGSTRPYFAAWIANDELLVRAGR